MALLRAAGTAATMAKEPPSAGGQINFSSFSLSRSIFHSTLFLRFYNFNPQLSYPPCFWSSQTAVLQPVHGHQPPLSHPFTGKRISQTDIAKA
jgi:hypothetical protein